MLGTRMDGLFYRFYLWWLVSVSAGHIAHPSHVFKYPRFFSLGARNVVTFENKELVRKYDVVLDKQQSDPISKFDPKNLNTHRG